MDTLHGKINNSAAASCLPIKVIYVRTEKGKKNHKIFFDVMFFFVLLCHQCCSWMKYVI